MENYLGQLHTLSTGFDGDLREEIEKALDGSRLAVDIVTDGVPAASRLEDDGIDCVLAPYPSPDSADLVEAVRRVRPDLPVVFVLTDGRADTVTGALEAGASEYVRSSALAARPGVLHRRVLSAIGPPETSQTDATAGEQLVDTRAAGSVESRIQHGEHVAEAIVDNFPNGAVTLVDEDLRYRQAGGRLFEQLQIEPDDVIGSHVSDVSAGDRDAFVRSYSDALDGSETAVETDIDGIVLMHRTVPVYDATGAAVAAIGMTQDITERKRRQRELERNRELLSEIQSVADIGGWEFDRRSETLRWTDEVYRIHRLPPADEPKLEEALAFYHPEDREKIRDAYEALTTTGDPYDLELRIETADDEVRWVRARGVPWTGEGGNLVGARGTFQDITARKERERKLQRKSRAVEAAPIGIVMTDPKQADNPITYVNQTFLETSGYDRDMVLGRNCRFMQGEETDPETTAKIRDAVDAGRPVAVDIRNYRADGTPFWNHLEIEPIRNDDGELINFVGFQRDITERTVREQALEKRERILHELHVASRESYPMKSESEVATFVVEFLERAFGFEYLSFERFDEEAGVLTPAARSTTAADAFSSPGDIEPGDGALWEAYRSGDSRTIDQCACGLCDPPVDELLAVPVGDFGLIVVAATEDRGLDGIDRELIEVLATNAESVLQGLKREREQTELASKMERQERTLADLRGVVDAVQAIQRRIVDSDSRDALEESVCEELLETERVDFVWIGHPRSSDTDLEPSAWAGDANGYLDAALRSADDSLPAQRAAAQRQRYGVSNVAERVVDEPWAKEALSLEFRSALSVPLVYDGVLYGTVTVYSSSEEGFDPVYENLLDDVASLVVAYSRILEQRHPGSEQEYTELEFELTDTGYPLQRLAADTESEIRYDTVAETTEDAVRILVTVTDGDASTVLDRAQSNPVVREARWFGDRGASQLSLTVERPFLATLVGKHGAEIVEGCSNPTATQFSVSVPQNVSTRPLLDALTSRFSDIELAAQRQQTRRYEESTDDLTPRQFEVLNAAYHGGYYETPRRVTGEDLAETFGISGPAVSKHLKAAHRRVMREFVESGEIQQ